MSLMHWGDKNWMFQKCCYWFTEGDIFVSSCYIIHSMLYASVLLCEAHHKICFVSQLSGLVVIVSASGWQDCRLEFVWVRSFKYCTDSNGFRGW
jgi:hypothetical protein